jgi:hypothetical protein
MLRDRESIAPIFFVRAKEYVRWGTLYQLFSCSILRSTSVSELIAKLYKVENKTYSNPGNIFYDIRRAVRFGEF